MRLDKFDQLYTAILRNFLCRGLMVEHHQLYDPGQAHGWKWIMDDWIRRQRELHAGTGGGHAGCFRTLAWYCTASELMGMRTVVAATPEVLALLGWRGPQFQSNLDNQRCVWPHEAKVFEAWHEEARKLGRKGWPTCPKLDTPQRIELFWRIARFHKVAWNSTNQPSARLLLQLADQSQFRVSRRWVRAAVQLLNILNPPANAAAKGCVQSTLRD